ncbi:MAG: DUF4399 domain-containing protein [Chitinophagaceae bacterium]|nr:DUF4399 domain-containing protein [Chitinophagaceae bacterium]
MRKFQFVPALMIMGIVACNNASSEKKETSADTTATANHDSMHHDHTTAAGTEIAPVPEIPAGAKVYFKNLKDGQTVTSPFKVEMGADNISVDTARDIKAGSGHHHILIGIDSLPSGMIVPKDSVHLHFGNAQKEAELTLPPGKHKIALQFADGIHRSYGSKLSTSITVNVKK